MDGLLAYPVSLTHMSAQAQVVDSEAAQKSSLTSEFPLYVAPQPSDNADILDPEFPGEGTGKTQMHDKTIEAGLVAAPAVHITEDEYQLMVQEEMESVDKYAKLTKSGFERLEDEGGDSDMEDELEQIRRRRLQELQRRREAYLAAEKFGSVQEIDERSFTREVQEASEKSPVLMLLWRDESPDCLKMLEIIRALAERHPTLKFCSFRLREAGIVENFPLHHCPTLMCYHKGSVVKQFVTLQAFDGPRTSIHVVEWELAELKLLETDLTDDPRILRSLGVREKHLVRHMQTLELSSDDDDDDGYSSSSEDDYDRPRRGGFIR